MENLLFSSLSSFLFLLSDLFCWFFSLFCSNLFWKTFSFPSLIKQIFKCFTFNKWKLFFNLNEEINFLWLLICFNNTFFNDFLNLFWSKFNTNTTIFGKLFQIYTSFKLFIFKILNGEVKLTGVRNTTATDMFGKNLSVSRDSLWKFSCDWVKHVTNFFFCTLKTWVSNNLKEYVSDSFRFGKVSYETLFESKAFTDFDDLIVGLFLHLRYKRNR